MREAGIVVSRVHGVVDLDLHGLRLGECGATVTVTMEEPAIHISTAELR